MYDTHKLEVATLFRVFFATIYNNSYSRSYHGYCISSFGVGTCIYIMHTNINPYPAMLFYLNLHPLEDVFRYHDPELQVADNQICVI